MLSAIDLIKEGIFLRVGTCTEIKIWYDQWIPKPSSYSIQTPINTLHHDAIVKELIE